MKSAYLGIAALAVLAQPALAQDRAGTGFGYETAGNPKAGIRIEGRASYETPTVDDDALFADEEVYKLGSAFAFGGEAGFDLAVNDNVVLGPYGNYEKSSVESCVDGDCVRASDSWSVGAHVGLLAGTSGMIYGKLGYTSLTLEADIVLDGAVVSGSESSGGISGAIGYEHGFGSNLYGRIEGGYADVGEIYGLSWQRRYAGVALGARF